jgi:hypothetical protein
MKYRKLPLTAELESIKEKEGDEALWRARTSYFLEVVRTKGFQFVTEILRNLEQQSLQALRSNTSNPERLLGIMHAVEYIRNSLTALLPAKERKHVDWLDDEQEDYLNLDNQTEEVWE